MVLLNKSANHQIRGFTLATIARIMCNTSMALPEWRNCYLNNSMLSYPSLAFVNIWEAYICHHNHNSSHLRDCHYYTCHNNLVPLDIRVSQILLLVAKVVGLVGTVCSVFALQQLYTEELHKNNDYNPFVLSAVLNAIASTFIFLAVMCNHLSVPSKEEVSFLQSFQMPIFSNAQRAGRAMGLAYISAILFLLSAIIFISYCPSMEIKMFPRV